MSDHGPYGALGLEAFGEDNSGHDTDCDCKACLVDTWHAEVSQALAENERLTTELDQERRARGLEQVDAARLEAEIMRVLALADELEIDGSGYTAALIRERLNVR